MDSLSQWLACTHCNAAFSFSELTWIPDVGRVPKFALGDADGIASNARKLIIMVDTTCNSRVLHFARANYKVNFQITNLQSDTPPALAYKAPGSFQETGKRTYSFLMYRQPRNRDIPNLQVPAEGAAFDAKKFQSDNGLSDAEAGVGFTVDFGGQANCNGGPANGGGASTPAVRPPPPSTQRPVQSPSPPPAQKTTVVTPDRPSVTKPAPTPVAPSPAPVKPSSENNGFSKPVSSKPVAPAPVPTSVAAPNPPAVTPEIPVVTPSPTPDQTEVVIATSFVPAPAPPVATQNSTVVVGGGTPASSTSPGPAQQTTNGAAGLSMGLAKCMVLAAAIALAVFAL